MEGYKFINSKKTELNMRVTSMMDSWFGRGIMTMEIIEWMKTEMYLVTDMIKYPQNVVKCIMFIICL